VTVFRGLKYDERIDERLKRRIMRSRHGQEPNRRGSSELPSSVRELMALNRSLHESPWEREGRPSFWERPSHALPDREDPAAEGDC
jgi:hypothetical protein